MKQDQDSPSRKVRFRFFRRHWRLSIGVVLGVGLSGVVVLAVASVLYLGVWAGGSNTIDLTRDKTALSLSLVEEKLAASLDSVRAVGEEMARTLAAENVDPLAGNRFADLAGGALAALPQVDGIAYVRGDMSEIRVARREGGQIHVWRGIESDPNIVAMVRDGLGRQVSDWGPIFWINGLDQPVIAVRVPIWRGSGPVGVLGIAVTVTSLSRELDELARTVNATPFVLSGRDRVVAHPNLRASFGRPDPQHPLPRLDQVNDPLLAGIWEGGDRIDNQRSQNLFGGLGRIKRIDGRTYLFAYREIDKYGGPWLIGLIQAEATLGTALDRIWDAVVAGIVVLILAFLMALFYARWITRHLRAFAGQARAVRNFDFETERRLQRSRLREIDDTAQAFNAMIDGLKWFESYVPRQLVRRLMRSGDGEGVASVQRDLTVLFTDIAGFTTLSETMSAGEVASFLNHHFGLLAGVIDREDGTVDKHLGDGIMAFWGAPEPMQDHALRACRAALAIRATIEEDNRRRREQGLPAIRVRIGIQSGGVTVGNIGAASRLSYTIVGDPVNAASRLCELAKQLDPEGRDVPIAIGDETVARLAGEFDLRSMGDWVLRGRRGNTEVFELCGVAAAARGPVLDGLAQPAATG